MARDHELLTIKEIGDLLRVHPSTIYKLTKKGKIPSFRIGSDWRFRRDTIESWIAEQTMGRPAVRKVIVRQ
jgi:excisionase family DNA binding protein